MDDNINKSKCLMTTDAADRSSGPEREPAAAAGGLDSNQSVINQDSATEPCDHNHRKTEQDVRRLIVRRHKCHSRVCPVCGPLLGYETREVLSQKSELFSHPALITLTVDQNGTVTNKGFPSAREAWECVTTGGFVSRLMGNLNIREWVWVLEFQDNGFPHWHVLVNLPEYCQYRKVAKCLWHYWRDLWKIGGCDLSVNKFENQLHAVRYVTKYLTKPGKFPAWFLELRKVRVIQGSRAVGRLVMREKYDASGTENEVDTVRSETRPVGERIASCGQSTELMEERIDPETGELKCHYVGVISVAYNAFLKNAKEGMVESVSPYSEVTQGRFSEYRRYGVDLKCSQGMASTILVEWLEKKYAKFCNQSSQEQAMGERKTALLADFDAEAAVMREEMKVLKAELESLAI